MTRILQGMGISRKFFLAFVGLLMVCQLVVGFKPPKDIGFSFLTHKKENKIYITYYDGTTINILGTYGYMDNPERYVSYYKNKSWIGCLPKEASSNISDSGNKSSLQSFIVFFANVATKDVITLTEIKEVESPEYLFHILDIGNEQQKVVVIFNAERQNIRLFRVYDDGGVDKEFSFPVDFYPDYFTIEHLEGSRYKLLASELGRKEYYTVDFDKRIVY